MLHVVLDTLINYYAANPLAQSVGILALGVIIYGFLQKDDEKLKYISWCGILLLGVHFFLLWFYIAALVNLVAVFRNFISIRFVKSNKMVALFSLIYISFFFITFESVYDILLISWWLIVNFAYFKFRGITLKSVILGNSFMWLIFNIHSQSIGGIITSASIIITLIIPIISLYMSNFHLRNNLIPIHVNVRDELND